MRVLNALFGAPDTRRLALARLNAAATAQGTWRDLYDLLDAYYQQNNLYEWLSQNDYEAGTLREALKGIRTPAFRIVQFYVDHLWPGDLAEAFPVETERAGLQEPMEQVWEWSNWAAEKDVAALQLAKYGDLFVRVTQPDDRSQVYWELVAPSLVTDFTEERGLLKEIRLDVPVRRVRNADGTTRYVREAAATAGPLQEDAFVHTEVWSKYDGTWRRWEHKEGLEATLERLGAPTDQAPLSAFGVDFVPFVHAKFGPSEDHRGASVLVPGLDKFDELNRKATRHSQMMFKHISRQWALERSGVDQAGRPVPTPRVGGDDGTLTLGDESLLTVPGGWTLKQHTPDLDYAAYLTTIESEEASLAKDYPEMLWSERNTSSELSGRALRFLLAPAIKRVERARGNAERALRRAMMMALSVGQSSGLFSEGLGSYDAGDFAHTYAKRDVLPSDSLEDAQGEAAEAEADLKKKELGVPLRMILAKRGYTEEEIAEIEEEAEKQKQELAKQMAAAGPVGAAPAVARNGAPATGGANGQFGRR